MLAAASLVIVVVGRGLAAEKIASELLRDAGQANGPLAHGRRRMRVRVLLSALSLVLAFAAIALYVWMRGAQL
jgi:hypothetical protein